MKKIFISWSKAKSGEFAKATKHLIETIVSDVDVFMSEVDIHAGEHVQEEIIKHIEECDILILCFTTENKKSPWLLYEAGYSSGLHKHVIPFLFDKDFMWHSWIDNPMNIAREIDFNRNNLDKDFHDAFSIDITEDIKHKISVYIDEINTIKDKYRLVDVQCEDLVEKLVSIDKFTINSPIYRDKVAYFLSGFETFELWKAIIQSFLYSGKYLWIYGRKNMKLFGGNFNELFDYLDKKSVHTNMDGIDFKMLFLNPNSEEVHFAHKDQDIFTYELQTTIMRAKKTIGANANLQKCFRQYSNRRDEIIIRVDNCIIYCKPHFDVNGAPNIMTDNKFEIFSASSDKGKYCINKFLEVWENSIDLFW